MKRIANASPESESTPSRGANDGRPQRQAPQRSHQDHFLNEARQRLARERPEFSASKRLNRAQAISLAAFASAVAAAGYSLAASQTLTAMAGFFCLIYLLVTTQRIWALWETWRNGQHRQDDPEPVPGEKNKEYPVYSILIPLYKEANQIPGLVENMQKLDWPREKMEIFLICEEGDLETIEAIRESGLPSGFEFVVCPEAEPKTKPKALNFTLPLCRGDFVVVYDAESRPESDQLLSAWNRFERGDSKLACLQAPLLIHNRKENWLTRMYALEYETLFTGILPLIGQRKLPMPLGGTSNHFRAEALKAAGAWDPYNVTEDADLGIRLHRLGYHCDAIASPTWEESPPKLGVWINQRSRWFKGWMQTVLVHWRHPVRIIKDMGWINAIFFNVTLTMIPLSMLLYVFFPILLAWQLIQFGGATFSSALLWMGAFCLFAGYAAYAALSELVRKRNRSEPESRIILLSILIYWFLISAAGWKGAWGLIFSPFHWAKTPHGLAKRSIGPGK